MALDSQPTNAYPEFRLWPLIPLSSLSPRDFALDVRSALVLLLLLTLTSLWVLNATRYSRSGLPGPPTLPIAGSLPWLPSGSPKVALGHLARRYGPIFQMNYGMRPVVIIADGSPADRILVEQSGKVGGERSWMSFTKDMEIDRLFPSACSNDNPIIEPCRRLNMKVLRMVGNAATDRACRRTMQSLASTKKTPLDPTQLGMNYGLVLLADAAFGLQHRTVEDIAGMQELKDIFSVSREVLAAVTLTSEFYLTFPMLCLLKPWEAMRSKAKARDIRHRFILACQALEKRMLEEVQRAGGWDDWPDCTFKQTYGQGSQDGKKISLEDPTATDGFLHPLLQSVITLVAGAHSISAVTAAVLACLAHSQTQQEKLHADVLTASSTTAAAPKLEQYPPRALAVVRETLRRFSPAPVALPLQTSADISISPGVTLHKGTMILPLSDHLNKANEYDEWDPDHCVNSPQRIIDSAGERGHFSFGFGRRRCPAADFSERAIAAFVTDVVQSYRIEFEQQERYTSVSMEEMMDFEYTGFNQAPRPPKIVLHPRA